MRQAFPDALDLLLICVESGMSIEHAFRKVSTEIGGQSVPLAEEFALCTAELSYLAERRQAYENLAQRTGLEGVKSVSTALIQAERYGTPLGTALRTLAQESRDQRMNGGREEGRRAAAEADRADDPVLPAGAVRRHPDAGADPGLQVEVKAAADLSDLSDLIQNETVSLKTEPSRLRNEQSSQRLDAKQYLVAHIEGRHS